MMVRYRKKNNKNISCFLDEQLQQISINFLAHSERRGVKTKTKTISVFRVTDGKIVLRFF